MDSQQSSFQYKDNNQLSQELSTSIPILNLKPQLYKISFNQNTTTQEWMQYLSEIVKVEGISLKVFSKLVMYNNQSTKLSWVKTAKKEAAVEKELQLISSEEATHCIQNWTEGITIASLISNLHSLGTLAVFTNSLSNTIQQQKIEEKEPLPWHTYAVFYQHGIIGVYDPSFTYHVDKPKLKNRNGVPLLRYFISQLQKKGSRRSINSIWFGGGGNNGRECQEMTRKWIYEEIFLKDGKDLGNWKSRKGWVEIEL
jgi:hypothetical protein